MRKYTLPTKPEVLKALKLLIFRWNELSSTKMVVYLTSRDVGVRVRFTTMLLRLLSSVTAVSKYKTAGVINTEA